MTQADAAVIRFTAAVPQFTVPDLVQTAEYYRDVLGFRIAGYWDGESVRSKPESPPLFAILSRDQVQIFFNCAQQLDVRTGRAEGAYDVYLRVVGIDALAAELSTRGADIIDGPIERIYGQREFVVREAFFAAFVALLDVLLAIAFTPPPPPPGAA